MPAMRDFMGYLWTFVCLLGLGTVVLTIYDWVCDNLDVVRMAEQEACADEDLRCHAQVTLLMRTPITQSFELATAQRPRIYVRCSREWLLLGEYRCKALEPEPGSLAPAATTSARTAPRTTGSARPGK
jgi:hypothetical protein